MAVFAILLPQPQPQLVEQIERVFPNDHRKLTDTQFLISAELSAVEVTARLGIVDKNPQAPSPPTGVAIVLAVSSYYGRAPSDTWEWMKARMEGRR